MTKSTNQVCSLKTTASTKIADAADDLERLNARAVAADKEVS
jgi:hypothetical protein